MQQVSVSKTTETAFAWSDAWVLASVAVGGGLTGCRLKDIIAAGDLINRALINAGELRNALGKLIEAGHVERNCDSFVISGEARTAVERLLKARMGSFSVMQFFEEFLEVDSYPMGEAVAPARPGLDDITDAQVDEAALAYQEELASLWRELRRIDRQPLPERALRLLQEVRKARG
jgi:hypothetical protein